MYSVGVALFPWVWKPTHGILQDWNRYFQKYPLKSSKRRPLYFLSTYAFVEPSVPPEGFSHEISLYSHRVTSSVETELLVAILYLKLFTFLNICIYFWWGTTPSSLLDLFLCIFLILGHLYGLLETLSIHQKRLQNWHPILFSEGVQRDWSPSLLSGPSDHPTCCSAFSKITSSSSRWKLPSIILDQWFPTENHCCCCLIVRNLSGSLTEHGNSFLAGQSISSNSYHCNQVLYCDCL